MGLVFLFKQFLKVDKVGLILVSLGNWFHIEKAYGKKESIVFVPTKWYFKIFSMSQVVLGVSIISCQITENSNQTIGCITIHNSVQHY